MELRKDLGIPYDRSWQTNLRPTKFIVPADGPLVQIPGTGVIWKICGPVVGVKPEDDD